MEVLPCARVAHIERTKKPYNNDIDYYAKRNALRAAEVWMDEYKSHVYMAWNIPMNVSFSLSWSASPPRIPQLPVPASLFPSHLFIQTCSLALQRHESIEIQNSDFIPFDLHTGSGGKAERGSRGVWLQTDERGAPYLISLFSYTSL